jgi:hypothetical protein
MLATTAGDPRDGWIGGRAFDLVFFFGSSVFAALVGVALLLRPACSARRRGEGFATPPS